MGVSSDWAGVSAILASNRSLNRIRAATIFSRLSKAPTVELATRKRYPARVLQRIREVMLPTTGPVPDLPLVGHALAMQRDPLLLLTRLAHEHGGMAPLHLGPMRGYLVSEPALLEEVFRSNAKRYTRKTQVYDAMAVFLGRGILTTEGEHWRKHRRIVQPAFHKRRLQSFTADIVRFTREAMDSWRGEFDAREAMMRLTLRIVSETLLGVRTGRDADVIGSSIDAGQRYAEAAIGTWVELPLFVPTRRNRQIRRANARMDEIAFRLIAEKRREPSDDVLSMLIESRDEDGNPLPDRQIRDELLTLLGAGHETTANGLTWTLMYLSKHPGVMRRLQSEVDEVLGDREPSFEDIAELTYTRWVLDESLRLSPPAWTTGRISIVDHELGGRKMPPGTVALLSPYVTHRRADLWDNPEGFDPDRWEALSKPGALAPFTFFPFGGGPRKCVGEAFAYLESTLVLAMIAQRRTFALVPGHPIEVNPQITLGLKHGLRVHARERV